MAKLLLGLLFNVLGALAVLVAAFSLRRTRRLVAEPGELTDNPYIESFNERFRADGLNQQWFETLSEAREEDRKLASGLQ